MDLERLEAPSTLHSLSGRSPRGCRAVLYSGTSGSASSPARNRVPTTMIDLSLEPNATFEQDLPPVQRVLLRARRRCSGRRRRDRSQSSRLARAFVPRAGHLHTRRRRASRTLRGAAPRRTDDAARSVRRRVAVRVHRLQPTLRRRRVHPHERACEGSFRRGPRTNTKVGEPVPAHHSQRNHPLTCGIPWLAG